MYSEGKVYYTNAEPVVRPIERIYAQVFPLQTVERSLRRTETTSTRGYGMSSSPYQPGTSSSGPTPPLTPGNSIRSSSIRSLPPTPAPDKPLPPLPGSRAATSQGGPKVLTRLRSSRDLPRIENLSLESETETGIGPFLDYLARETEPKTPLTHLHRTQDVPVTQSADLNLKTDTETGSLLDDLSREADELISEYASLATTHDSDPPELEEDDGLWYEALTSWEYAAGRQADADRTRDEIVRAVREAEEERGVREREERIRARITREREERVQARVAARREEMRRERQGRK